MTTVAKDKRKAALAEKVMDSCECTPDEWVGRVEAGDIHAAGVSAWVCGNSFHRAAAEAWAEACMGLPARFIEAPK